mgnify:CR=1 FL=1
MSELNLNKLKMQTPNICDENIKKLKELFPQIVSEDKIDFDILKQLLSNTIVEADDERYRLDWVGKKRSLLKANSPINKTLRPCESESVDFENTKNLYIEGDNFEVLKLLQESYLNKIKMIYIDPPYNTGKDSFPYPDDYSKSRSDFEDEIGLRDEEGNKLFKNTDKNGRFHSDWLSMMYERLLVARDLLKDDGVIFISIDDNEVHNLRKICDEIFGEANFINLVSIKSKDSSGASGGGEDKRLKKNIEFLLIYSKSDEFRKFEPVYQEQFLIDYIDERKKDGKSFAYTKVLYREGEEEYHSTIKDGSGNDIKIYTVKNYEIKSITELSKLENILEHQVYFKYFDKIFTTENAQTSIRDRVKESVFNYDGFINIYYHPISGKNKGNLTKVSFDGVTKRLVSYLSGVSIKTKNNIIKRDKIGTLWNDLSWSSVSNEGSIPYPSGKKPIKLIDRILKLVLDTPNEIILDFFAGSSSSAHSVINYNFQNSTNHKFIMVQIKEEINIKDKEQKKLVEFCQDNNVPLVISEIGKERIRRAGKKILEDNKDKDLSSLDIGFRVLKLDSTNFKDVYYHPNQLGQGDLLNFETNIKEDRSDLDLLFSIMLDLGICLDLKITTKIIDDKKLYFIENNELIVCFQDNISLEIIQAIKEEKPLKVVLKDGCFANDTEKINAILELSLITSISVI